ncbi:hypothetical protein IIA79_04250 [bacterium]|nr:hypothetical protein [bacterium]
MALARAIWAVVAGTFVAAIIGAMFDYFRDAIFPGNQDYKYLYPWVTAVAGLCAALMTLLVAGSGGLQAAKKTRASAERGKGGAKTKTSSEVPGMPTYDFKKGAGEPKGEEKSGGDDSG